MMPRLMGGKVNFFHFIIKYNFFQKIKKNIVDKIQRKDYYAFKRMMKMSCMESFNKRKKLFSNTKFLLKKV